MNHLHPFLSIKTSADKGHGVFAFQDIEAETLLEVSPVIVLSEEDTALIHKTHLHDYYFSWDNDQKKGAIGLGYISVYNHSNQPNCLHDCDFKKIPSAFIQIKKLKLGKNCVLTTTWERTSLYGLKLNNI